MRAPGSMFPGFKQLENIDQSCDTATRRMRITAVQLEVASFNLIR